MTSFLLSVFEKVKDRFIESKENDIIITEFVTCRFCVLLKMCFSHKTFFCLQNLKRETEAVIIIF